MPDAEDDSQMVTSPEESDTDQITTPENQITNPADTVLSPPASQRRKQSTTSLANSNGKRPLQHISNGADDMEELQAMGNGNGNGKSKLEEPFKTHESSGYTYNKPEDEPGYAWLNKKAQDEYSRAWEGMQHKDSMVKNRYGDPFEMVEKEKAILASLKER